MRGRSNAGKYYENFYEVFEQAVLNAVKPNMILSLSGGWDTRVIAGILAKNNVDLPTMTTGSKLEILIASRIAKVLNLKHYSWQSRPPRGYKYLLTGHFCDEINGGWRGAWARTHEQFERVKRKYMKDRRDAVDRYQRDLYPLSIITPILNPDVVACLQKIPWQLRTDKKMQRWILKNKFPKLWHIPYYNSLLPCFLPYYLHGLSTMFISRCLRLSNFLVEQLKGMLYWRSKL